MLNSIKIENFKSIYSDSIELGRVNVFIGANGSGKSNILEAIAMLSSTRSGDLNPEGLTNKGVRVAMPSLTFSSFLEKKAKQEITLSYTYMQEEKLIADDIVLESDGEDIYSGWKAKEIRTKSKNDKTSQSIKVRGKSNTEIEISTEQLKELLNRLREIDFDSTHHRWNELSKSFVVSDDIYLQLKDFVIYNLNTEALRGISVESRKQPLGIYGEGLDVLIANLNKNESKDLLGYNNLISWLDEFIITKEDNLKYMGYKLGRSNSKLYFKDKFMQKNNNIFSAENSNEGALHILFYLTLFISRKTPSFFAIDNIETALNPKMCRNLIKEISHLSKKNNKQVLITTHNPAILDGLNLNDDEQRLFEVYRNEDGHTRTRRIKIKPQSPDKQLKLSEMWLRGLLGAIDENF